MARLIVDATIEPRRFRVFGIARCDMVFKLLLEVLTSHEVDV